MADEESKHTYPQIHDSDVIRDFVAGLRSPEFQHVLGNVREFLGAFGGIVSQFQQYLEEISRVIRRFVAELPPRYRAALVELAERGWYFDKEMAFLMPHTLAAVFAQKGAEDEAEALLVEHFRARLDAIEAAVCERFPRREKIVRSAMNAHRNGLFELSIPPLLAQVDGICKDTIGVEFFMRIRKRREESSEPPQPLAARYATLPRHTDWDAAWLSPLTSIGQVSKSESERGGDFVGLNRHQVMHGESVDYGTELNSLKAISLLNYVCQVLPEEGWNDTLAVAKGKA